MFILPIAILLLLLALSIRVVRARPPEGLSTSNSSLVSVAQPGTNYLCCSDADCRNVQYRSAGDHFEAFIDRKSFGAALRTILLQCLPSMSCGGMIIQRGEQLLVGMTVIYAVLWKGLQFSCEPHPTLP